MFTHTFRDVQSDSVHAVKLRCHLGFVKLSLDVILFTMTRSGEFLCQA